MRSATARLATKKLNGERRLRFGSKMTASTTKELPSIAVREKTEHKDAVVILSSVGADIFVQG